MNPQEVERLGNQHIETATNLRVNFLFHWSLLSGATATLIIPLLTYLSERNQVIYGGVKLIVIVSLLILAIILPSIRNYIASHGFFIVGSTNIKSATNPQSSDITKAISTVNKIGKVNLTLELISILSYIIALILIVSFIWQNLPIKLC